MIGRVGFRLTRLSADSDSSDFEGDKVLRAISKVGEFRNWAATVQTAPAKVLRPKSTKDVLKALKKVCGWACGSGAGSVFDCCVPHVAI